MEPEIMEQDPMDMEPAEPTVPDNGPVEQSAEVTAPAEAADEPVAPPAQDATARLATDFLALTEEFPQIVSPSQLPDSVLEVAAQQGIPLLDAYLRYRWQEEKRVAAASAKRQQAAAQSAGSLSRGAVQTPPEQDAFLRAFRSAL